MVLLGALAAFVASELVARFGLGLGDPPLFVRDESVEYMLKPGTYRRFGHSISINRWSQRSPEIEATKTDSSELRVLVIGDSVNGGALLDDAQIATRLLQNALEKQLGRPVRVLNIAAGSWGPQNQLAYLEKFGTFSADVAVVVWSSHDAWDVPRFDGLREDQPEQRPILAVGELFSRYVLPRLRRGQPASPVSPTDMEKACASASALLTHLKERGIPTRVVLHATQGELTGAPDATQPLSQGREHLLRVLSESGVAAVETAAVFRPRVMAGETLFQDDIHPNATGQKALEQVLEEEVRAALKN